MFSCSEDKWLEEKVYDFYTPGNSFVTEQDFDEAVARLYIFTQDETRMKPFLDNNVYHYLSDMAYGAISRNIALNDLSVLVPEETTHVGQFWADYYRIIYDANVVINRIDGEGVDIESQTTRNKLKAEAMFFRAFAYRCLGHQYGGVPIVLEETSGPKRDFVRSTRQETYNQAISDLEFAKDNLPTVNEIGGEDGRLTKAAANHLLAELYNTIGDFDKAIAATSAIINSGDYELMTERFGTWSDRPGDVYGDLFRRGNQNRSSGNREGIWVAQYEFQAAGGGEPNLLPRIVVPRFWVLKDADGVNLFTGPNVKFGGRGIGWTAVSPWYRNETFGLDNSPGLFDLDNDMRVSEFNMIKDIPANNPASSFFGQNIVESGAMANLGPYDMEWSVVLSKTTPIDDFPDLAVVDPETGLANTAANASYRDHYYFRLAETYLLRAEAYLGKGDLDLAAADINVVRARANATPVASADVDIDYILDERVRELAFEEYRMLTLMRLGKFVERVKKYNPMYNGEMETNTITSRNELWPIPASEIERNTEAVLEQNPGY